MAWVTRISAASSLAFIPGNGDFGAIADGALDAALERGAAAFFPAFDDARFELGDAIGAFL
ncbi:hypothetical protein GC173_01165 [bacterium]|nr:hypothetical protein [bacterium]